MSNEVPVVCPKCHTSHSVTWWTNETTGERFYVCSGPRGCKHTFTVADPRPIAEEGR